MVDVRIGRHGVILLVLLFFILGVEDVIIWMRSGAVPGLEFFVASLVVVAILAFVIWEAQQHQPP